jgi:DNA-binding transcriptional LysR family regulator
VDTIQCLRIFVRVVETGSFTTAAQSLNTTTAQTSRSVADLEAHLHARLLNRTTRRLALTEAGERFLTRCQFILSEIDQAEAEARDAHATPIGRLRVHSMTSFGIRYVVPLVARYAELYPLVNIDLTLQQRAPDLLEEGIDVSLVLAKSLADSNHVSQRLGASYSVACASPQYLQRRGVPQTLGELDNHVCLHLVTPMGPPEKWVFQGTDGEEEYHLKDNRFRVNIPEALAVAISSGMGIGVVPSSSIANELANGRLVRVLPDYRLDERNIFAIYPSRQYLDAKIRTWVDFLRRELPALLDEGESLINQSKCVKK